MKRLQKGFTLIELLVVIAIIGILAAIVLASLSTARSKAKDAKGEGELAEMRSAAEIYYSSNPAIGYSNAANCTDATANANMFVDVSSGMNGLTNALSAGGDTTNLRCDANGSAWAAEGELSNSQYWCVDSSGKSENAGTSNSVTTSCP